VTLNLKTENGKQLLREMVAKADILVNFSPGVMQRLASARMCFRKSIV
jgi:formyl-CoA transferase